MVKPNFFIIGAPKCGTTALSAYLSDHPDVYISHPKEPHYFNDDLRNRHIRTLPEYLACFDGARPHHRAIGEASVHYLYSRTAVLNILDFQPEARFIVMVRNPLEMARSWYSEAAYRSGVGETAASFEDAWYLQEERRQGRSIPRICREPKLLQYQDLCSLGAQLERLFAVVPRDRVHIIVFDDFVSDTRSEFENVLKFLNVPLYGKTVFPRVNEAKEMTMPRLYHGFVWVRNVVRSRLGLRLGLGVGTGLRTLLTRPRTHDALSDRLKADLVLAFAQDVQRLEKILERELSHWMKP
jgi:hypothetical protein